MTQQYLILHKVRGEPQYDIAEKCMIGDEEGWVLSTCGHRAYPFRYWTLDDLKDVSDINNDGYHNRLSAMLSVPDNWPDHYEKKEEPKVDITALINEFVTIPNFKRRI